MKKDKAKDEAMERTYPELNLEKWSIWQPANSRHKQMKVVIERGAAQVTISANSQYGPLTTEDQKVYYALIDLFWKWVQQQENGSTEKLSMSERYLSRILDKKWNGKVAKVVAQCLYRLRFTAFTWQNSYYDSTTKQTVTLLDTFTILSDLKVAKTEADGKVNKEVGYFSFCDLIVQNLLNGHTKPLLLATVLNFKSEVAQMLYHHLDLVMADKDHYERRTAALFFEDLQLKGEAYKKPSERKRKLEKALPELQGVRLTTGTLTAVKLEQTKDGKDYKLVCHKMSGTAAPSATPPDHQQAKPRAKTRAVTDPLKVQAEELVHHFYKLFHPDAPDTSPRPKELGQARALIVQHGFEQSRYLVDFSHTEAAKTDYAPQTFGGILHYVPKALASYERNEQARTRRQAQAEAELRQQEEACAQLEARLRTIPAEQHRVLYEKVTAQLLADFPYMQHLQHSTMFRLEIYQAMVRSLSSQAKEQEA